MEPVPGEQASAPSVGKKEKRFLCDHCGRGFARLEHLQRHERIRKWIPSSRYYLVLTCLQDSGVKPFSCSACNYSFTRRYEDIDGAPSHADRQK